MSSSSSFESQSQSSFSGSSDSDYSSVEESESGNETSSDDEDSSLDKSSEQNGVGGELDSPVAETHSVEAQVTPPEDIEDTLTQLSKISRHMEMTLKKLESIYIESCSHSDKRLNQKECTLTEDQDNYSG